uniref:5'-nucleotidase n=1 Tax=Globisporangium ultimum (strain ATCC 200006 / CBS 805.95 / DAOM BR144) TaxID=431595 RepID=K3X1Q4_GLOUD
MGSPSTRAAAEERDRKPIGKPMMFVRDPDAFAKKWKKFSTDGIDRMLVIADFDFTLTTNFKPSAHQLRYAHDQGERGDSSHGVLMRSNSLDPAVGAAGREMFLKYYPIEQSPTLSNAEKLPFIIEWWTKEHETIVQHKLTKQNILDAVQENEIAFRDGFHDIFALLAQQNVPTLIFSAGLYDVIHAVLDKEYAKQETKVPPNVHVISNMMRFDEHGAVMGFDGNLIHSLNKNASVLQGSRFWQQCQMEKRHNILLLGDSLGDANMADGLDYDDDEIVRVGFLNDHVHEKLDVYLQHFDVVLTNDASLLPVELLLHQVTK